MVKLMVNDEDKEILINEIKKIVDEMGCYKENYIFLDNNFITRQLLIYDYRKIITFL